MNKNIEWNDGLGSRSRSPWLLLIKGEEIVAFTGETIPGFVVVRGTNYKKNGKWSNTTYRLTLADGVREISGRAGWESGLFVEGLGRATSNSTPDTWTDLAKCLGVSVPAAMKFIRGWKSGTAKAMDETEAALVVLEESTEADDDTEKVTVSFGSPTNRSIRNGFWESPKSIPGYEAEIRLVDPSEGWSKENIEVVGISGTVLSAESSSGMHGGYRAVTVAVIPGTETEIPPFMTAREKAAKASGLPEDLYHAFGGDEGRVREYMAKVEKLDAKKLDAHEFSCGRARKRAEVISVSGDKDFFLGADPLSVCGYIEEVHGGGVYEGDASEYSPEPVSSSSGSSSGGGNDAMAAALKAAGLDK